MAMYVYNTSGHPVGFLSSIFIHDFDGRPLGRILGTRVYRLDGVYIGEFYKDMVVAKPSTGNPRDILPMTAPKATSPGIGPPRRNYVDFGYADVFHLLYESASQKADNPEP
jgi:hypothetical protein